MKKHIPNFITCLNLFSGCVAVYFAFRGDSQSAFLAIMLAAVFDFLDGFAARLLHAYSPMGKELDSLADMISFGLAPGAIVFSLLTQAGVYAWLPFIGFLIPVFSGLRLAKFNIDTRQTTSFIGLPTPANAIFWAGLGFSFPAFFIGYSYFFAALVLLFCYLMVSEIPMFSLKITSKSWKENIVPLIFLAVCLIIMAILGKDSFSIIIVWYIVFAVGVNLTKRK